MYTSIQVSEDLYLFFHTSIHRDLTACLVVRQCMAQCRPFQNSYNLKVSKFLFIVTPQDLVIEIMASSFLCSAMDPGSYYIPADIIYCTCVYWQNIATSIVDGRITCTAIVAGTLLLVGISVLSCIVEAMFLCHITGKIIMSLIMVTWQSQTTCILKGQSINIIDDTFSCGSNHINMYVFIKFCSN